ncbi:hypothetical protein VNI00_014328 [Paramarasmius palmivorus]|uniref:DUF6534 domain-containing protein n=1 Tax=Paramarasmius palmivorus TaxID=297713 RepID=A0AAW0BQQ2_9AGAR
MSREVAEVAHGPMYIGFLFNLFLFGIVTAQIYMYMTTYKSDKLWMKLFVATLYFLNILNTVFIAVYLYSSLILNFADIHYLEAANWVFATDPVLTGIVATLVQLFFAWRVKVLTSSWWLMLVVIVCSLAGLGGAIGSTVGVLAHPKFVEFQEFKAAVLVWLAGECIADAAITTILVSYLVKLTCCIRQHKSGFKTSDELIDRIIRMTIQTGVLTSACALIDLILFVIDPTGLHLIFNFPLAKLYTNTLMSSLNSRSGWAFDSSQPRSRSQPNAPSSGGLAVTTIGGTRTKTNNIVRLGPQRPEVFVHVESHELQDRVASDRRIDVENNWIEANDREGKASSVDDASSGWEPK